MAFEVKTANVRYVSFDGKDCTGKTVLNAFSSQKESTAPRSEAIMETKNR